MKNIIIICAGENYNKKKIGKFCAIDGFIIAADAGLKILDELSIKPDLIIGDMDSVDEKILKRYAEIKKEIFPKEKDLTDAELALNKAMSFNPERIYMLGATGSYFDHSFANIINLIKNYQTDIRIITENSEIFIISKNYKINNCSGRRISLFPVSSAGGIEFQGLKYNFKKTNLTLFDYSISNVIEKNEALIKIKKGMLICVLYDKHYE